MGDRRPRGVLEIGWACFESSAQGRTEHRPTSSDYPPQVIRRISFHAGGGLGWRLSALTTPRARPAPWKIVVVTGAPSWAEYWTPVMAALGEDRQMIAVDRPGFAASEPATCVPDLRLQAEALSPVLQTAPGQKLLLVGQSYGAAIAALMAARARSRVDGLLLLSSFLGEPGPTAKWLIGLGSAALGVIPRDLRHAVIEVGEPKDQYHLIRRTVAKLKSPVALAHGDRDDFAPIETARRLAKELGGTRPLRFHEVAGAGHFLNDGPPETLLPILEAQLDRPARRWRPAIPGVAAPRLQPALAPA